MHHWLLQTTTVFSSSAKKWIDSRTGWLHSTLKSLESKLLEEVQLVRIRALRCFFFSFPKCPGAVHLENHNWNTHWQIQIQIISRDSNNSHHRWRSYRMQLKIIIIIRNIKTAGLTDKDHFGAMVLPYIKLLLLKIQIN